ncbi:MAG: helix-turn-helix domain-containing protein [Butyrivibrio sp.]|nr:helix-turn-helix domain-containing protein [Butyrivibrio sp.]
MNDFFSNYHNTIPSERLDLLTDLLSCGDKISFWIYSQNLRLISTNSAFLVQNTIFEHSGCLAYMGKHFKSEKSPIILSSSFGLMWAAAKIENLGESENTINYIVIGPVLSANLPMETLQKAVNDFGIVLSWRKGFIEMMQNIPIVSSQTFFQYSLMLHFCATGEKLGKTEISFQENNEIKEQYKKRSTASNTDSDRTATYRNEQEILNNVRTGNLNYASSLERAHQISNGIRVFASSPLQQAIISTTSFTSLCVRAAIEGGLSPETAYSVGDSYIQSIVDCKSITDVRSVNHAMYDDFIHRVHNHKHSKKYSAPIQSCVEYIELHLEDDITLEKLSKRLGYTTYYLSHKFKKETGSTMKNYIKNLRLEKAKTLLLSSDYSISKIADMLHFCSSSYFSSEFNAKEGMLPQEFRNQKQRL